MCHLSAAAAAIRIRAVGQLRVNDRSWYRRPIRARLYTVQSIAPEKLREESMKRRSRLAIPVLLSGLALLGPAPMRAADPEIDRLLQSPVGKDWITNGGNLTNQRYSTLNQINTTNVKQLK